ncbi:cytochrome P450 [Streptomyces specialis]|uniref:cytochrome P450 n=1 Tax=Streptomyces specialis TaxID=498367 RepID=UPI00073F7DF4|nr:cytochrome P450 [Streptomyces specialis]
MSETEEFLTHAAVQGVVHYPAARIHRLTNGHPIQRMSGPDGHPGWLVTGYSTARAVLAHPHLSSRAELRTPPEPAGPPGMFALHDGAEHLRYRRLLTGQFTVRRMRALTEWIARVTEEHADRMRQAGPPADLLEHFALPIPALVISELLGVPAAERETFRHDATIWDDGTTSADGRAAAFRRLSRYLGELVVRKRAEPRDDLLSGLVHHEARLTDEELTSLAFLLLIAGRETTAHQLGLGVYTLLTNPPQLAALRADPGLIGPAVEELLRCVSVVRHGPVRTALEDIEIDGHTIRAGETVTVSLAAVNTDPGRFDRADLLDITRPRTTSHLAFGHGAHQCLGQQLARVELRQMLSTLLAHFPHLRLAVPADDITLAYGTLTCRALELPVTW